MNIKYQLPQSIAIFFQATDVYDIELLTSCFTEDALLVDEGDEYHGPSAISAHIQKANQDAKVKTEITNYKQKNDEIIVTTTISGDFPGSPIPLDFHFTLNNEKIKNLAIVEASN